MWTKQKTFRMAPKCVPPGFMVGRAPRAEGVTLRDPCELRDPLSPGPPLLSSPVEPRDRTAGVLALLPGKPHRRREIKNSYGEADIGLFCLPGWERSCADPGPPLLRSRGQAGSGHGASQRLGNPNRGLTSSEPFHRQEPEGKKNLCKEEGDGFFTKHSLYSGSLRLK